MTEPTPAMLASAAELVTTTVEKLRAAGVSDHNIRVLLGVAAEKLKGDP